MAKILVNKEVAMKMKRNVAVLLAAALLCGSVGGCSQKQAVNVQTESAVSADTTVTEAAKTEDATGK